MTKIVEKKFETEDAKREALKLAKMDFKLDLRDKKKEK